MLQQQPNLSYKKRSTLNEVDTLPEWERINSIIEAQDFLSAEAKNVLLQKSITKEESFLVLYKALNDQPSTFIRRAIKFFIGL
jgi:hypothetical protein